MLMTLKMETLQLMTKVVLGNEKNKFDYFGTIITKRTF